jgi:flagellar motility protein MotE (MotC chaperone)
MNAKQAYAALSAIIPPPVRPRQWRFLPYVSVLLLLPVAMGLAFVLGGFLPSKAVPPPATAGENSPVKAPAAPKAEQMLTLSASDIPLLQSLQERQARLEERETQLAAQEEGLRALQRQLEEKLATLAGLRKEIGELIEAKEAFEEKRFEHLVKVYEGMKPEEVASLIQRLNEDTAVKLFYQMKKKKVSQVLGFLHPDLAVRLSERLAVLEQKEPPKATKKGKP